MIRRRFRSRGPFLTERARAGLYGGLVVGLYLVVLWLERGR